MSENGDYPRRTWRRVIISVFGVLIIVFIWRWSVGHLYTLPQHAISAFASLTTAAYYTISIIVVFLVTGLTFFSWTQSSSITTMIQETVQKMITKTDKKEEVTDAKTETTTEVKKPQG